MSRRRRRLRPLVEDLDERCLLSGFTPAQIAGAYGLGGLDFPTTGGGTVKGDGSGETIALIEMYHDPNVAGDLHTFDQRYGLPDPTLNVINQAGNQTDASWGQEEAMDVEWAHAIAPGASLLVVEAAPGITTLQAFQNLMSAVKTASDPATIAGRNIPPVAVVSMSWGFSEFDGEAQYDSYFTTPGITYIAASGDAAGMVDYPAASPDVIGVGGTSMTLGAAGAYGSETAWYDSGGGYSVYESEPAYQRSVQATGHRSVPDVAFDGDPNTGAMVYFTGPSGGGSWQSASQGAWYMVGGTSLGAPSWAGIVAIADQGRVASGQPNLSGATQTLPTLYGLAAVAGTAGAFHAVTPTATGTPWDGWGAFGWGGGTAPATGSGNANIQTGLGTPVGGLLIPSLTASHVTAPLPSPAPSPFAPTTLGPSPTTTPSPSPVPTPTTPAAGKHRHHHRLGRRPHAAHRQTRAHPRPAGHRHRLPRQASTAADPQAHRHRHHRP